MRKHQNAEIQESETLVESEFDNTLTQKVKRGDTIIERDTRGRVKKRTLVTDVSVSPAGCWYGVHITVKPGNVWCYDQNVRVEIDTDAR